MTPRLLLGCLLSLGMATHPDACAEISSIGALRALSPEEVARAPFVEVTGTIVMRRVDSAFLQDADDAVWVSLNRIRETASELSIGNVVRIRGTAGPGLYATTIVASGFSILGDQRLGDAPLVAFTDLLDPAYHCRRVRVRGVLRRFNERLGAWEITLDLEGRMVSIMVPWREDESHDLEALSGAFVEVTAASAGRFNKRRQIIDALLYAESVASFRVVRSAPAPQRVHAQDLLTFRPELAGRPRVRIRGQYIGRDPKGGLFLRDGERSVKVFLSSPDPAEIAFGSEIEVVGFSGLGVFSAILNDADLQVIGNGTPPLPVTAAASDLTNGAHDGDLVTVEATLASLPHGDVQPTLSLSGSEATFQAPVLGGADLPPIRVGDLLRVTGIWEVVAAGTGKKTWTRVEPKAFRLILGDAGNVEILSRGRAWHAEWFRRAAIALGAACLLIGCWVASLQRQVRSQTKIISEQAARDASAEERQRIAREFHDTLEQELTGIRYQVKNAQYALEHRAGEAKEPLNLAVRMLQRCVEDARATIWDLRLSEADERPPSAAIEEKVTKLRARGQKVSEPEIRLQVTGTVRPIGRLTEHHLVRIGQEALENAVEHAGAEAIAVDLAYSDDSVTLTVTDDGCGFDPSRIPGQEDGHFGITGMEERASRVRATFCLESDPGEGTVVSATFPIAS